MKTSVMEVQDMLSVLSVAGVEERIGKVPGVESVTVNFAAGNATVRYDETRLDIADIRSDVRQSGHETDSAPAISPGKGHEGHGASGAPSANAAAKDKSPPDAAPASPPKPAASAETPAPAPPKSAPADAAVASSSAPPASGGQPDKVAPSKS